MYQDSEQRQAIKPKVSSDAPKVMPHEGLSQPATLLDGEAFNARLRGVVSSVKHGFRSEGVIVDFKEVCEDKVRFLNEGDNLRLLLTPLTADGTHGRAFFELFGAGTDGDNILRFCQQELNMSADEAKKALTSPGRKGASKDQDVMLPLSLRSASPWIAEFMERHWNVPGTNIALAVRHTGERVSVGVCLGFEPFRTDVGNQPIREERSWDALRSGFATCAEVLGPFGGLIKNCVELTQIFFTLPTALRKGLWGLSGESGWAALSVFHGVICAGTAMIGSLLALDRLHKAEIARGLEFNDLGMAAKYAVIVLACNLASLVYEWGYQRHKSDKRGGAGEL
jgi:hypothetical protein